MTEPTPFELQQVHLARIAAEQGFTLVTHLRFSLVGKDGFVVDRVEGLDEIGDFLKGQPPA
jgi:hypothetical protein